MRKSLLLSSFLFAAACSPAFAGDKPDQNGCYQNDWLSFLGVSGSYCSQEYHVSQDGGNPPQPTGYHDPYSKPVDHCPKSGNEQE